MRAVQGTVNYSRSSDLQGRAQEGPGSFLANSSRVKPTAAPRNLERHVSVSLLPPPSILPLNFSGSMENLPRRKKPQLRLAGSLLVGRGGGGKGDVSGVGGGSLTKSLLKTRGLAQDTWPPSTTLPHGYPNPEFYSLLPLILKLGKPTQVFLIHQRGSYSENSNSH